MRLRFQWKGIGTLADHRKLIVAGVGFNVAASNEISVRTHTTHMGQAGSLWDSDRKVQVMRTFC